MTEHGKKIWGFRCKHCKTFHPGKEWGNRKPVCPDCEHFMSRGFELRGENAAFAEVLSKTSNQAIA